MKAKTIKAIISKKIKDWASTIEDESLRGQVLKNTIVTGGAIPSMLCGEAVNDFDVYFRTRDTVARVARYYLDRFTSKCPCNMSVLDDGDRVKIVIQSAGIASDEGTDLPYQYFENLPDESAGDYVAEVIQDPGNIEDTYEETERLVLETEEDGKPKYRPVFVSTNAITLSGKIQIILRFYGEPDEIHENYDYVHCTNYWTSWDNHLELRKDALESLLTRELRYIGSKYPICSIVRLRKFIRRGWTVNAGQILKMCWQISELDLSNISVLEDQLTGVDVAYFMQLIERLKERDPEKVNAAYLVEIIDRLF